MSSPWIWKGVSATLYNGRYTLSYPRGRCESYYYSTASPNWAEWCCRRQEAVSDHFPSKQLLCFVIAHPWCNRGTFPVCWPVNPNDSICSLSNEQLPPFGVADPCSAVQSQNAVSAHFTSKQILPFGFADHYRCHLVWSRWGSDGLSTQTGILLI